MTAIPTTYASVRFRSRLEARWAAFFDLLEWDWDYEPLDLCGYIPDFIVDAKKWQFPDPFLVEVKPFLSLDECLDDAKAKIDSSGWDGKSVIVGAKLHPYVGADRLCAYTGDAVRTGPIGCRGTWWSGHIGRYGFDDNDHESCTSIEDEDEALILGMWREAGNRVQWRGPRAHAVSRHVEYVAPSREVAEFVERMARPDADEPSPDSDDWQFNPETDIG